MLPSRFHDRCTYWLFAYFRSGWAFLIPYLGAYLFYAKLQWPVNPTEEGTLTGIDASGGSHSLFIAPCSLLGLYWFLHGLHLILGALALRAWLISSSALRSPLSIFRSSVPWICLALLFWIPGVYMEFPADPWHHYARINEWSWLHTVTDHSYWLKFSHFLGYSVIGHIFPPILQLKWFDAYYTACCLLLCWQYYKLARAIGLGTRGSLIFLFVNALMFGNNLFGFYRYYGMSSTVFSQLGAVALTRVAFEMMAQNHPDKNSWWKLVPPAARSVVGCTLLLALIGFNHVQGLGLAGLGIAAVIVWRLIKWRRSLVVWLAVGTAGLSGAAILWYPREAALDQVYRAQGWLTPWYGFNFWKLDSPAFERASAIIGLPGLVNLVAGLFLLRRNHLGGWITLMPLVALSLPFVTIPFAGMLARASSLDGGYLMAYSRMLFAIPAGLALVIVLADIGPRLTPLISDSKRRAALNLFYPLLFVLFALIVTPSSGPYYNRFYHSLVVSPADMSMKHVIDSPLAAAPSGQDFPDEIDSPSYRSDRPPVEVLTTPGIGYVLNSTGHTSIPRARKWMTWPVSTPPSQNTTNALENLRYVHAAQVKFAPFWPQEVLFSSTSSIGYLSGHWLPQEVALEHAGQSELFAPRTNPVATKRPAQLWLEWIYSRDGSKYFGNGAGSPIDTISADRGSLNEQLAGKVISAGDRISISPVLHTLDGNGLSVELEITGPQGYQFRKKIQRRANPLGGETWLYQAFELTLPRAGTYSITLAGMTVWPTETHTASYTLDVVGEVK